MDDQQTPVAPTRPDPASRICLPAEAIARRTEPGYPRQIRTGTFRLDLPRSAILAAIDDAATLGDDYAPSYRLHASKPLVFGERLVLNAEDEMRLHDGITRFVEQVRAGGYRLRILNLKLRRDAIHARMREIVGPPSMMRMRNELPTTEQIGVRDRLLMRLRSSACLFSFEEIAVITECMLGGVAIEGLGALADAEHELVGRLDHADDAACREQWISGLRRVVAGRDREVRRARWAMEHRIARSDPTSAASVAWVTMQAVAKTAVGPDHASEEDRVRVLLAWIAADGGRTIHAASLSTLWQVYPLRTAHVRQLIDAAIIVGRMQPVVEDIGLDDRADIRRDWQAGLPDIWHEVGRLLHACGDRIPGSPNRRLVPGWARDLARSTVGVEPIVIADHLAREFEGEGPSGLTLGVERGEDDRYVISCSGSPRRILRTVPRGSDDDGDADEHPRAIPSLDLPDPDADEDAAPAPSAVAGHAVAPATTPAARPVPAAPSPQPEPEPVAMAAPSTAAELAAAKSDSRVVREAHAIASRARREIVGQERAIRMLSAMVAEAKAGRKERGIGLLAGSSGSGKTHAVGVIAGIAGLPFLSLSVANFVSTGIRGPNVDDIALGLIRTTKGDLHAALHGVVLLDEADKLMMPTSEYGPTVLGQLLRICDGEPHMLGDTMDRPVHGLAKGSIFPTKDLVIIMAGAWSAQRDDAVDAAQSAVGFAVGRRPAKDAAKLSLDDLHGVPRELRGRISRYAHLDDHDERSLTEIADRFGAEYMKSTNTWTRVDADARFALVTHALGRGTGARGLRSAIVALRDWLLWHPDQIGPKAAIGIAHVEAALAEADGKAA